MPQKHFLVKTEGEITTVTGFLLEILNLPTLMLLHGNLGAGKTTLAKHLLERLGIDKNQVKSPTYSLINNFQVQINGKAVFINHIDLYRLEKHDPLLLEEINQLLSVPSSITLIEWPEKLDLQSLISNQLQVIKIDIALQENHSREFTVKIKP